MQHDLRGAGVGILRFQVQATAFAVDCVRCGRNCGRYCVCITRDQRELEWYEVVARELHGNDARPRDNSTMIFDVHTYM